MAAMKIAFPGPSPDALIEESWASVSGAKFYGGVPHLLFCYLRHYCLEDLAQGPYSDADGVLTRLSYFEDGFCFFPLGILALPRVRQSRGGY